MKKTFWTGFANIFNVKYLDMFYYIEEKFHCKCNKKELRELIIKVEMNGKIK